MQDAVVSLHFLFFFLFFFSSFFFFLFLVNKKNAEGVKRKIAHMVVMGCSIFLLTQKKATAN